MKPFDKLSDDELADLAQRAALLPDAPPSQIRSAIDLWNQRQQSRLGDLTRASLRLVQAVLSFDSWAQPAPALGMRASASDLRHLLFSAEGRDIDLRIVPVAERFALSGQVLGPYGSGMIELASQCEDHAANDGPYIAALDELGEFRIDGVPGGSYRLTLRMGSDEISLPPIDVGARP
jgi:hypothetical protein